MFRTWVHPCRLVHAFLSEQGVGNYKIIFCALLNRRMPFELAFPTPSLPMMLFHRMESRPTVALKSPVKMRLSSLGTAVMT